jgi:hypothetical protein
VIGKEHYSDLPKKLGELKMDHLQKNIIPKMSQGLNPHPNFETFILHKISTKFYDSNREKIPISSTKKKQKN